MNMLGILNGNLKVFFERIEPALSLIKTGAEVIIAYVAIETYRRPYLVNQDEKKVANGLPNGNKPYIATVQAWSHCMGYARNVYPELENKIKKSEFYRKGSFPVKEFNLIPQSAQRIGVEDLLKLPEEYDLKAEGQLEPIKATRGSNSERVYTPTIYTITDPLQKKKYYFVAHIPYSLSILRELEKKEKLTKDERINEMGLFRIALPRIVELTVDESCRTLFTQIFIEENASSEEKAQIILKAITDECQEKETSEMHKTDSTNQPKVVDIDYCEDITEEKVIAETVRKMIEEKGYTVNQKESGTSKCEWKIIVLSKKRLEKMCHRVEKWMAQVDKNLTNKARIIAILTDDLPRDKCPCGISILVDAFLQSSDPALREKLLKEIETDRDRRLCIHETVYSGLAYSYVFNYLEKSFGLDAKDDTYGFDKRLSGIHQEYRDKTLFKKFMIIVPNSFLKRDKKDLEKEENDRNVSGFRKVKKHPWENPAGGVKGRQYQMIAYTVQEKWWKAIFHPFSRRKEFIIFGEYPNPLVLLSEIQTKAHWDDKKLQEEVDGFVTRTEELIQKSDVKDQVRLLKFSDKKGHTVRDELMNFLKKQKPEDFYLVKDELK